MPSSSDASQKTTDWLQGKPFKSGPDRVRSKRLDHQRVATVRNGDEGERAEHFCTLFNFEFLPQGLALYRSLLSHASNAVLWVLCMDREVEVALQKLNLPSVRVISSLQIETCFPKLLEIKAFRKVGEYCWTMTPFLPEFIFKIYPELSRVTYVDADLLFLAHPSPIFEELDDSGKDILITEHDYDTKNDFSPTCGRFCVQFIPFRNTASALRVLRTWQNQCIEWCFDRSEAGRYGDQMYLDSWPEMYPEAVHILQKNELAMGPWNDTKKSSQSTVFYHMSSFRMWSDLKVRYYSGFSVSQEIFEQIHVAYEQELIRNIEFIVLNSIDYRLPVAPRDIVFLRRKIRNIVRGKEKWGRIDLMRHRVDEAEALASERFSPSVAFERAFGMRGEKNVVSTTFA